MDHLTALQYLETNMEYMKFCAYVIEKEMEIFNLDLSVYQSFVTRLPGILDVNFDIAYNRCAFIYKYSLCNMYFFKYCMDKFLLECKEFKNLVSEWTADSNIRLCSMSCGPGLDYLSFMLALSDHLTPPSFKSVTILSKHGAWRNTLSVVADAVQDGVLSKCGIGKLVNFKNTEVVQANLLISIPDNGLEALQQSRVILMVRNLNLRTSGSDEEEIIKAKLMELISLLKPDTTFFFIDTKTSLALCLEVLSKFPGKFLCKPDNLCFKVPITFSEDFKVKHGRFPVLCSKGSFFVWQKLSSSDPNVTISPLNYRTGVKEVSKNFLEKGLNENDEVLNFAKTLKVLILPSNKNLQPDCVDNVTGDSHINDNIGESVSATCISTPKQLQINKFASIQTLLTSQSVQKQVSVVNFDEKSGSSHLLKKASSIDNSFFQGSTSSIPFLGESNSLQNSLHSWINEKTYPTNFPQHNATEKKFSENKENDNVSKSNQALKPPLETKATQTELHQSISNSTWVKDLTERVKRLISSLENKVQKNIPDGQVNYHLHESPDRSANYSSCSTNCSNNSDGDIKPPCCNGYQNEGKNPISCCNYVQMNHVHCCAVRHNMMHRCEMHCCRSCVHGYHINHHRPLCESNIACTGESLAQPQIVIPLQNVSSDILLQLISAAKLGSKSQ